MTLDEILKEIKNAESIVVLTHESPDGDAVGSSTAMRLLLKSLGKSSDVIIPKFARIYNFLPGIEEVKTMSDVENYDLAISLDCADVKRLAGKEYFENTEGLEEQKREGTTFESWLDEMEKMQILNRKDDDINE